jgi:hypothetical protein
MSMKKFKSFFASQIEAYICHQKNLGAVMKNGIIYQALTVMLKNLEMQSEAPGELRLQYIGYWI